MLNQYDFKEFLSLLTLAYRVNFTDTGSMDYGTAKHIFSKMLEKHWTYKECSEITNNFIESNPWRNFAEAEFFMKAERPSLYGEAWKNAEKEKNINAIANMECYEIPDGSGQVIKMYRYRDDEHPIKGLKDIWAKQNTMKAYAAPIDSTPVEIKPIKENNDPDKPIDCEKFLKGFAKNLFKSGDYDRLSEEGKQFINEYLQIKKTADKNCNAS